MFCFLIPFPYYRKSLSPFFGDNTTDVKTNKIFFSDSISTYTFMWNSSLRKLTHVVPGPNPVSAYQIPLPYKYQTIYSTEV